MIKYKWFVIMALWIHLFPSRTEKLSTVTLTIVSAKIGHRKPFFVHKIIYIYFIVNTCQLNYILSCSGYINMYNYNR